MSGVPDRTGPADQDFILTCYEVLLGRELDSFAVVRDRGGWPKPEVVKSFVGSPEFAEAVLSALETGYPFIGNRFPGKPSLRQRLWAAEQLPIGQTTAQEVRSCQSWRQLLGLLLSDPAFAVNLTSD